MNALVWRLHEQQVNEEELDKLLAVKLQSKASKVAIKNRQDSLKLLSISKGRSMCTECRHTLAWFDLLPVLSWLSTGGRCRYCHKRVSVQYPIVELLSAVAFIGSYAYWPVAVQGMQAVVFGLWLIILTGLIALTIYDARWYILPNRIIFPSIVTAILSSCLVVAHSHRPLIALGNVVAAVLVGGGIFHVLYVYSDGRWIGGGDVKLGWLLGLLVATPARSLLVIFLAAILGCIAALPLLISKRLKATSEIPFGPFLIIAGVAVVFFGASMLHWYQKIFLPVTL